MLGAVAIAVATSAQGTTIPSTPLVYGFFTASFNADGTFSIRGQGWATLTGSWKSDGGMIELVDSAGSCATPGRYRYRVQGTTLNLDLVGDECKNRRMILDRSAWRPAGEKPVAPSRRITRTAGESSPRLPEPAPSAGSWPSFRGPYASGVRDGVQLPLSWNGKTGENILWRTAVRGLAHSSPIVWGDRVFVTTAVSSAPNATFKPGLYGDGDASDDRSRHRWMLIALDARTGRIVWERVAHEGEPIDKRHIKSTYASATPATDGRLVVAAFGSQGLFAYDVNGVFRWKVDLGRLDVGAYDIPSFEWGPASSPILWNGLVFVQCDTHADSFLLALNAETGEVVWKTDRDELPSWGTPTVVEGANGAEIITNAPKFIRGYDARTGAELWRVRPSSNITAPTPVSSEGLIVVASGRAPERPIFVVRAGSRGDLTLPAGTSSSEAVAWSRTGRGSYMPTPLIYRGSLYVLANNGVFDAYDLTSGKEIYRARVEPTGSGFSASPVAADGYIYVSGEDGDMFVIAAGPEFKAVSINPMGELLMATPALSNGVMYVRSSTSIFAIGRK